MILIVYNVIDGITKLNKFIKHPIIGAVLGNLWLRQNFLDTTSVFP